MYAKLLTPITSSHPQIYVTGILNKRTTIHVSWTLDFLRMHAAILTQFSSSYLQCSVVGVLNIRESCPRHCLGVISIHKKQWFLLGLQFQDKMQNYGSHIP